MVCILLRTQKCCLSRVRCWHKRPWVGNLWTMFSIWRRDWTKLCLIYAHNFLNLYLLRSKTSSEASHAIKLLFRFAQIRNLTGASAELLLIRRSDFRLLGHYETHISWFGGSTRSVVNVSYRLVNRLVNFLIIIRWHLAQTWYSGVSKFNEWITYSVKIKN